MLPALLVLIVILMLVLVLVLALLLVLALGLTLALLEAIRQGATRPTKSADHFPSLHMFSASMTTLSFCCCVNVNLDRNCRQQLLVAVRAHLQF